LQEDLSTSLRFAQDDNWNYMQIRIEKFNQNLANAFRSAGYVFQHQAGDEMSFVRAFSAQGYPRFHVFAQMEGSTLLVKLHLDMKKETYGEGTRHHGEYEDSQSVSDEGRRLRMILE